MAQEFSLVPTTVPGRAVVTLRGDLDVKACPLLGRALAGLVEADGTRSVTADVEGLTFIDSAGIHTLIEALKRLRRCGGPLILSGAITGAFKVLDVCGLTGVFSPPAEKRHPAGASR